MQETVGLYLLTHSGCCLFRVTSKMRNGSLGRLALLLDRSLYIFQIQHFTHHSAFISIFHSFQFCILLSVFHIYHASLTSFRAGVFLLLTGHAPCIFPRPFSTCWQLCLCTFGHSLKMPIRVTACAVVELYRTSVRTCLTSMYVRLYAGLACRSWLYISSTVLRWVSMF